MEWETPILIGLTPQARGLCSIGSGDGGACKNGSYPGKACDGGTGYIPDPNCSRGVAASSACTPGPSAGACGNGNSAGACGMGNGG